MNYQNLFITAVLCFLLSCTLDLAGTKGGSETTNGITACILYPDGTPAAGSIVRLRKSDYVSEPASLTKKKVSSANTTTNPQGHFTISGINAGTYFVEVQQSSNTSSMGSAVLLSFSITEVKDTLDLGTKSLHPLAAINGQISNQMAGSKRLFVQVKGLERITEVDSDGTFAFYDLPEGNLDFRVVEGTSTQMVSEVSNVRVSSGDTLSVDIPESVTYSRHISISTEQALMLTSATITNFPLLVSLNSSSFDFSTAHMIGNDIRFTKMNNTPLPYEIEEWEPQNGRASIWVRIDSITTHATGQFIIMNWGQTGALSESNGTTVFDTAAGFAGVWHLNENPSSGINAIRDRTIHGCHGTAASSMTSSNVVSGVIGSALMFNGITDSIKAGLLDLHGNYTLSCWVRTDNGQSINWRFIIREKAYTLWYDKVWDGVRVEHNNIWGAWEGFYNTTPDSTPHALKHQIWHHVATTYDGTRIRLYIDGDVKDSTNILTEGLNPGINLEPLLFGGRIGEYFKGTIDEIRIERKARSPEWIRLCYLNQKPGSTLVKLRE